MKNHIIDYDSAYNICKEITLSHYENFPVGSFLVPNSKRKYIYSIYAFARFADDIADNEKLTSDQKLEGLKQLDNDLSNISENKLKDLDKKTSGIFTALHNTINELKIPADEFRNLLKAFAQDSVKNRYDNFEELIEYSKLSANPVGHLVLYVFGYSPESDEKIFKCADKICTALQLTNFWQDTAEDLKLDRVYIPTEMMKEYNYSPELLFKKTENDDFLNMLKTLVLKTRNLFDEGKNITGMVKGRLRLELKATIYGGEEILNKIESCSYRVLSSKVKIGKIDKLKLILKTILN